MSGEPGAAPGLVVSVVVPCRNGARTIGRQLDGLRAQQPGVPWEVVLVDNGSTDGSADLARTAAGSLPLRVVEAPQCHSAGEVRNVGADVAEGTYLAFCDADDVVAPGWLSALLDLAGPGRLVAGRFDVDVEDDGSARLQARPVPQQAGLQRASYGPGLPFAAAGNLAVHRAAFQRLDGFDPRVRWLEDTDLCWRAQLAGYELVYQPHALVHLGLRRGLAANARQGWQYGRARTVLERRYAGLPPVRPPQADRSTVAERTSSGSGPTEQPRPSLEQRAWRLGWLAGRWTQRLRREP